MLNRGSGAGDLRRTGIAIWQAQAYSDAAASNFCCDAQASRLTTW
jgi:hypothetical protein